MNNRVRAVDGVKVLSHIVLTVSAETVMGEADDEIKKKVIKLH